MTDQVTGYQRASDGYSDLNSMAFLAKQMIGKVGTMLPVKVLSCSNAGGLSPVGYVDVQPMVDQHDGAGNSVPHGPLHNLPYARLQGGKNAVVMDPEPGDLGLAFFAQRDISAVKATKDSNVRGSRRRHDMADGCYLGGILNGAPTQYIRFSPDGIEMVSPTKITFSAPTIAMSGTTLTHNGVPVGDKHKHGSVQSGGGTSGVPVAS